MANQQYFSFNSLAGASRDDVGVIEIATAGKFDSTWVSNGIAVPSTGNLKSPTFSTSAASLWVRFDSARGTGSTVAQAAMTVFNGATGVFRLLGNISNSQLQPQYWNGSAWTNTGSVVTVTTGVTTIVCRIDFGVGFEVFTAGSSVTSASNWTGTLPSTATTVWWNGYWTGTPFSVYSQCMCSNYDLRDEHFTNKLATANGNYTDGTGTYTDANEVALDDSTAIVLPAVGNKKTFTKGAITVPSGYQITAAVVSARGRVSGGTVSNGRVMIRSAGNDQDSGNLGFGGSYEPRQYFFPTDPATSTLFTQTGFNNAEYGAAAA